MTTTITRHRTDPEFVGTRLIGPVVVPGSATEPVATPRAGRSAIKDIAPLLVALMPFSIAIGAAAQTNGLSGVELMAGAAFAKAGGGACDGEGSTAWRSRYYTAASAALVTVTVGSVAFSNKKTTSNKREES